MVTVKLIVLLLLVISCACFSKYCNICTNHVLCQYPTPGPSVSCKEYDRNKFLTDDDIYDLVNQINERRNFIALGHSRHLPSAANMNKLVWSEELATFAQRWVDQCDPYLRPDKEDQCRDLEHTNVGQNIASILDPSPRFSVKSFVEMWFMQLLDFKGSVAYYDKFQDRISNYFIQLIWAETEEVGCGRAKFFVNNVTVDRLVCNFSPKGNIQSKPIYNIGYPRTQCQNEVEDKEKFKGLCTPPFIHKTKLPGAHLPVSSLLKILNLSNDSVKQDIDPIYNNMKQIVQHKNKMDTPRHQIMRHIFGNKPKSKRTDFPIQQTRNFWESSINFSRNYKDHVYNRERGNSRLDKSHIFKQKGQPNKSDGLDDFRKYVKTTYSQDVYGNLNNVRNQCTRSTETHNIDCENSSNTPDVNKKVYQCTRGQKTNSQILQSTKIHVTDTIPYELCPCSLRTYISFPSTNTQRTYKWNCECVNAKGLPIPCSNFLRTLEDNSRNQNDALDSEIAYQDAYINLEDQYEWIFNKRRKNLPKNKRSRYIHSNRNRSKREFADSSTFKPFWQMDSFSYDGNPELKALRYTTLLDKRRHRTNKYSSKSYTTESITIKLKNTKVKPATEKYLSFDELLHLRKFNLSNNNFRRKMEHQILRNPAEDKPTTVTTEVTTESTTVSTKENVEENSTVYTANTPFVKVKHCTRKLTCTWTAASITDSNGSVIGDHDHGSRTPPGYVEGCTRTSTCTRDYMNRNKFPTTITVSTNDDDDESNTDSDYCERRSLNFRKRNSREKRSFLKKYKKKVTIGGLKDFSYSKTINDYKILNNDKLRRKRRSAEHKCSQNSLSYGDLYYLILNKIVKDWKNSKIQTKLCPCNIANESYWYSQSNLLFFFILYIFI